MSAVLCLICLLLCACAPAPAPAPLPPPIDLDGDGHSPPDGDCDDHDPTVFPGAPERCDGRLNDCAGHLPEQQVVTLGDRSYADLRDAIAASAPGDTLTLCAGTYQASPLPHDLTVRALPGLPRDHVVIEAAPGQPAVHLQAGTLTLLDLTVRGGLGVEVEGVLHGGALFVAPGAAAEVHRVTFEGGAAARGGNLAVIDARLALFDCEVREGRAHEAGGGLYLLRSRATLHHTRFSDNHGGAGGGLALVQSQVEAIGGALSDNDAARGGGASVESGSELRWTSPRIERNRANLDGGGLWVGGLQVAVELTGATVRANDASHHGGGAYLGTHGALTLGESELRENEARDGGAVAASPGSVLTLDHTRVELNRAERDGSGLWLAGARLVARGGGLYRNAPFDDGVEGLTRGGAIAATGGATLDLHTLTLVANRAERGGALHLHESTLIAEQIVLRRNEASHGAVAELDTSTATLTAVEVSEHLTLRSGIELVGSTALDRGGHYLDNIGSDGVVYHLTAGSRLSLEGTTLRRNLATELHGAALLAEDGASLLGQTLDLGQGLEDNLPYDLRLQHGERSLRWSGEAVDYLDCAAELEPWCNAGR